MADKTKNLLFGKYPLGLVRHVFSISTELVADRYDISVHTWRSYSSGMRAIPDELLLQIEDDVLRDFKKYLPIQKPSR